MPWKERTVEAMREEFVEELKRQEKSMSQLCREYGISRKTGYKWRNREAAMETMEDRSRAPHHVRNKTPEEIERKVLEVREKYPVMGAAKIHRVLKNQGETDIPCPRTINNIMNRHGKISREASEEATPYQRFEMTEPNEMWQMDFKGHFGLGNGERCHPLNILDDHSRFLLCSDACRNETLEEITESIKRIFREYGLPKSILCDNGNPWGTAQESGFTKFEVWMMELGILVKHIRIKHPQSQGKIERFNKSLQREYLRQHIITDMDDAQKKLDTYRKEYNYERPHHSLNLATPGSVYQKSPQKMPEKISEWTYGDGYIRRELSSNGCFSLNGKRYFLSYGFAGKTIAIRESRTPGLLTLEFRQFRIARIDPSTGKFVNRKAELLTPEV